MRPKKTKSVLSFSNNIPLKPKKPLFPCNKSAFPYNMQALETSKPLVCQSNSALIDALPYADDCQEYMASAGRLIEEELKTLPVKDYLKDFPAPETTEITDFMRIKPWKKRKLEENTLSEGMIRYGHMQIQAMNLDLLAEYGPTAWENHVNRLEAYKMRLEMQVKDLQEANEHINRERMTSQAGVKETLRMLGVQWTVLCHKGRALYREIKRLERVAEARRVREEAQRSRKSE